MDFYIKNPDAESPILAFKSSSLVSLELVFRDHENHQWMNAMSEWFDGDGRGPFRSVQKNDELKVITKPSYDDHRFKALFSHHVSEKDMDALLNILVSKSCLKLKYKQDLWHTLTSHFAKMNLLYLQAQLKQLLKQLEVLRNEKVAYFAKVDGTQSFVISETCKKDILSSIQRFHQVAVIITKMIDKHFPIPKDDLLLLQSLKPSCCIKSNDGTIKGYLIDEQFADDLSLFMRDFNIFLANPTAEHVSFGTTLFGLRQTSSESSTNDARSSRRTCVIL